MKHLLPVLLMLCSLGAAAHDFYTDRGAPAFTDSEQMALDKFNIHFIRLTKKSSIEKHNTQVLALIKEHGKDWHARLVKQFGTAPTPGNEFIYYLLDGGEIFGDGEGDPRVFVEYFENGIISSRKELTDIIGNSSAAYFKLAVVEKNWDENGKYLGRKKYEKSGSTCCFAPGTKITMADGSEKEINCLQKGDRILALNAETLTTQAAAVESTAAVRHTDLVEYDFGTIKISATADHPFYLKNKGWSSLEINNSLQNAATLKRICTGDTFYINAGIEMAEMPLKNIKYIQGSTETYAITGISGGALLYFANDVAVGVETIDPLIAALFLN